MATKYEKIKNIHELAVKTHDAKALTEIASLLNGWDIKCREGDGKLLWINLSLPTSIGETITIGLRYEKKDTTLTEDIFELSNKSPNKITPYYKGKYQKHRLEYKNTHKEQNIDTHSFTSVNSCSIYLDKNDTNG